MLKRIEKTYDKIKSDLFNKFKKLKLLDFDLKDFRKNTTWTGNMELRPIHNL